jgi:hypothetical protein
VRKICGDECKNFQKKRKCETDAKSVRVYLKEEVVPKRFTLGPF